MVSDYSFNDLILKFFYLFVIYKIYKLLFWIYRVTLRKRLDFKSRYGEGSWALITGATDGIGKGFTFSLAKEGFNIIQVSRSPEKLKTCEEELRNKYPNIKVVSLPFDFSKKVQLNDYSSDFSEILSKYDVSILVNNVGTGEVSSFLDLPLDTVYNTLVVNTLPQTVLTRMFAEKLLKREKRSAIINLSSVAAVGFIPNFALYSSTKVFNLYLSKGLEGEMRSKVDFLCVKPFGVESNISRMKKSLFVISAQECSEGSLDCLGQDTEITGHWNHDIQSFIFSLIPTYLISLIDIRRIFRLMRRMSGGKSNKK
jgi:17beta-estradiol 17-dehydrogenase / very-long-chain 3-oxoacyl-CoA reductase